MAVGDIRTDITAEECVNRFVPGTPEDTWVIGDQSPLVWTKWIGNALIVAMNYPEFWWRITDFDRRKEYKSVDYVFATERGLESIDETKQAAENFHAKFIKES